MVNYATDASAQPVPPVPAQAPQAPTVAKPAERATPAPPAPPPTAPAVASPKAPPSQVHTDVRPYDLDSLVRGQQEAERDLDRMMQDMRQRTKPQK